MDGVLDSGRGQFSGLSHNSWLSNFREQDMCPTNSGLVIHAHRAVGPSLIPPGSRFGGFSMPGFSSTVHPPRIVWSGVSGRLEVDCFLTPGWKKLPLSGY